AVGQLYDAAEARLWRDALAAADAVLAVAPEHREAKAIRGKAWLAASPETADYLAAAEANHEPAEGAFATTRRDGPRPPPPPPPLAATHILAVRQSGIAQAVPPLGRWRRRLSRLPVAPRHLRAGNERWPHRCPALRGCLAVACGDHPRRRGICRRVRE